MKIQVGANAREKGYCVCVCVCVSGGRGKGREKTEGLRVQVSYFQVRSFCSQSTFASFENDEIDVFKERGIEVVIQISLCSIVYKYVLNKRFNLQYCGDLSGLVYLFVR